MKYLIYFKSKIFQRKIQCTKHFTQFRAVLFSQFIFFQKISTTRKTTNDKPDFAPCENTIWDIIQSGVAFIISL